MDAGKIGKLIYELRKEKHMTQRALAERLLVSDKAVSKWERGLGCPDLSLLPGLSAVLEVDLEKLLAGELGENDIIGGNMKKTKFYICPSCGNVVAAMADTAVSCCGKKLQAVEPKKAEGDEKLKVEIIENEYFITADHPMTREHYITFVALLTGDTLVLRKQYPEWDLQTRIPTFAHGRLLWYCSQHGLFYQLL
ncbi:MAG: helix-turn-helix domain-containing protein [Butyricicoccus sp.]